jgi:hypothetical protein
MGILARARKFVPAALAETIHAATWSTGEKSRLENLKGGLYQILKAEDSDAIQQALQGGMHQTGFVGMTDAPGGIKFSFALTTDCRSTAATLKGSLRTPQSGSPTRQKGSALGGSCLPRW